nr:immunoglobulin light chain junction region [Macaca mulatta]
DYYYQSYDISLSAQVF